jgi:hypothetical protein
MGGALRKAMQILHCVQDDSNMQRMTAVGTDESNARPGATMGYERGEMERNE